MPLSPSPYHSAVFHISSFSLSVSLSVSLSFSLAFAICLSIAYAISSPLSLSISLISPIVPLPPLLPLLLLPILHLAFSHAQSSFSPSYTATLNFPLSHLTLWSRSYSISLLSFAYVSLSLSHTSDPWLHDSGRADL